MALRFGVSAVVVAVLIGITALVTNNARTTTRARASTTTSSAATTTPTTAVPAVLPAGCVDTVPPANPNRPTLQVRAAHDDRPGQDLHREALDELR